MKILILAGGQQSTISDSNAGIPKPMANIGGKPILWHIMKYFSSYGFNDYIVCGGYKVDIIKEYFMDYYIYQSDICVNLRDNTVDILKKRTEDWNVMVMDTGLYSTTGQRISMAQKYIGDEDFIVSYGDVLSDIDIEGLVRKHKESGKIATMAVAQPAGRHEIMDIDSEGQLVGYGNLPEGRRAWTNASVFVFKPEVFNYLLGSYELEKQLSDNLIPKGQVDTFKHPGFWIPIETKRDRVKAENLWNAGIAPWKRWED